MFAFNRKFAPAVLAAAIAISAATPAAAGVGDLLVAPTRIVLDGRKGTEIILNNIGDEPATYRVSVEFRRMTADGNLLTMKVAPDNGEEGNGTENLTYEADVSPAR